MQESKKIRFALIGCGKIAEKHVISILRITSAEIAGAYDIDQNKLKEFGKKYSVPVFKDLEEMIKKADPHVLNILTPSGMHAENILQYEHFKRHFVVEKPLALKLGSIDEALKICRRERQKIFVVCQNRFNPPVVKLKEAIDKGRFGKIIMGSVRVRWKRDHAYYKMSPWRGTYRYDGGIFANQANHHIDMLTYLMGWPASVIAVSTKGVRGIETEDTGAALFKFKNNAIGIVEATTAARPDDLEGSISILGERGSVEIGGFFMNELKTWKFDHNDPMDKDIWTKFLKVPDMPAWNHTEFFKYVIKNIDNEISDATSGSEGRKLVKLINAMNESTKTRGEIKLCHSGFWPALRAKIPESGK